MWNDINICDLMEAAERCCKCRNDVSTFKSIVPKTAAAENSHFNSCLNSITIHLLDSFPTYFRSWKCGGSQVYEQNWALSQPQLNTPIVTINNMNIVITLSLLSDSQINYLCVRVLPLIFALCFWFARNAVHKLVFWVQSSPCCWQKLG